MIRRSLFPILKSHLTNPEISLIIGPRQAGKTTLMRQLQDELSKLGENTLFLSLDNDSDGPMFKSQVTLLNRIKLQLGEEKGYVFIDEIQRKENAGLFLKGLYDRGLPYKLIISGSGSVELKEKVQESLAGRKRLFELTTLSFFEFVNFKTDYKYEDRLPDFFTLFSDQTQNLLNEYLNFGGYPKVILAQTLDDKTETIKDIYQSYLEKDIAYLLNVQKTESFTSLVRVLASQTGNLVNISELSSTLGISIKTVQNYLWYLEKTFIVDRVTPYYKNIRKEITKTPVIYFGDLGMKNYAQRQFGTAALNMSGGFHFENFIFLLLKEYLQPPSRLHFWRTQDKAEVDFVLDVVNAVIPIEVKFTQLKLPEISRSFRSFLHRYKPLKAYIIHLGQPMEKNFESSHVYFIPFFNTKIVTRLA